jgi:hypothetical protein
MRVKCIANTFGRARFGIEVGKEYPVLALEAGVGSSWLPPGLVVFVGREHSYAQVPIACLEVIDAHVDPKWLVGSVQKRWLIGYPAMLDEKFHIGLERGDDPGFSKLYQELMKEAI